MEPTNDLDHLAIKYGSDKFGGHAYTPVYNHYFNDRRHQQLDVLEIGIGGYGVPNSGGASLKMWHDYFTKSRIYGLDWHEKFHLANDRIKIFQGSQADPRVITQIIDASPHAGFDIVIDDGSHQSEHIITSFMMLFPYLKSGGWYVVEDIETSYRPDHAGGITEANRLTTMSFFRKLADWTSWRERDIFTPEYRPNSIEAHMSTIHFYRNLIIIGKI